MTKKRKSTNIVHAMHQMQVSGNRQDMEDLARVVAGIHAEENGLLPPITPMTIEQLNLQLREQRKSAQEAMKRQRAEERALNPRPPRSPRFDE